MSKQQRAMKNLQIAAATPRFSTLTICIRGALRGFDHPVVQHMIERNREIEMQRALLAAMKPRSPGMSTLMAGMHA